MLRVVFRDVLQPLAGDHPAAAIVFGLAAGAAVAVSFRLFANRTAIRVLRRKLWAHVLELRLFGDDPALALASLFHIVEVNVLLLCYALPPLLIAAPVAALLLAHLNDFFASTPLQEGRAAVLTVRLRGHLPTDASIRLEPPAWIAVDAPPVRIPAAGEVSWRLRASAPRLGNCTISLPEEIVTKELDSRPGLRYSGRVRARGWLDSLQHPAEDRLPSGPIDRVWISPDPQPLFFAGLSLPWVDWFAAAASFTAWLLWIPLARLGGLPL